VLKISIHFLKSIISNLGAIIMFQSIYMILLCLSISMFEIYAAETTEREEQPFKLVRSLSPTDSLISHADIKQCVNYIEQCCNNDFGPRPISIQPASAQQQLFALFQQALSSQMAANSIGSLRFDPENRAKVFLTFRMALGAEFIPLITDKNMVSAKEALGCNGKVHQALLAELPMLRDIVLQALTEHCVTNSIQFSDLHVIFGGHSIGSIRSQLLAHSFRSKLRASCVNTALLPIFDLECAKDYTRQLPISENIGFTAEEDFAQHYFPNTFAGTIVTFSAKNFSATFNTNVEGSVYPHIVPSFKPIIATMFNPEQWNAHMPAVYREAIDFILES
jgi:hypothetical protein